MGVAGGGGDQSLTKGLGDDEKWSTTGSAVSVNIIAIIIIITNIMVIIVVVVKHIESTRVVTTCRRGRPVCRPPCSWKQWTDSDCKWHTDRQEDGVRCIPSSKPRRHVEKWKWCRKRAFGRPHGLIKVNGVNGIAISSSCMHDGWRGECS